MDRSCRSSLRRTSMIVSRSWWILHNRSTWRKTNNGLELALRNYFSLLAPCFLVGFCIILIRSQAFAYFLFLFFLVWCSGQIASYQVTTGIDIRHNLFFTYNGIHSESQFLFTSPNMQITYTNKATESNRSSPSDESPIGKCLTMAEAAAARGEERQPCQPRCRWSQPIIYCSSS